MTSTSPRHLLDQVNHRWWSDPASVLAEVAQEWESIGHNRPPHAEDAEVCRQAMLAATSLGQPADARIWRMRALSRFVAVGWGVGAAAVLMTQMHEALSLANEGYVRGTTIDVLVPSDEAMAVLRELEPFATPDADDPRFDFGPTARLIARFVVEKQAMLHTIAGDYAAAERGYSAAAELAVDEPRGALKIRGGRLLVRYLDALDKGADTEQFSNLANELASEAAASDQLDIVAWASHNVSAMSVRSKSVQLYEML